MNKNRTLENRNNTYKVMLFLIIALAVLSNAMKDLNRLQEITSSFEAFAAKWLDGGLISANAMAIEPGVESCFLPNPQTGTTSNSFHWNGRLEPGQLLEVKGFNGDIKVERSNGVAEVSAMRQARRSDPQSVQFKVVSHPRGVTICAVYPTEDPNQMTRCEPEDSITTETVTQNLEVRDNDVRVDFKVMLPAGVDFSGRTVNGEIAAEKLVSNVRAKTVNGNISISTTGHATAKTVNGEISAKLGDANWTGPLDFKTVNGGINIEIPAGVSAEVVADTLNGAISSDFELTSLEKSGKRRMSGTIGAGGRSLRLKTSNGSINLRRVG